MYFTIVVSWFENERDGMRAIEDDTNDPYRNPTHVYVPYRKTKESKYHRISSENPEAQDSITSVTTGRDKEPLMKNECMFAQLIIDIPHPLIWTIIVRGVQMS